VLLPKPLEVIVHLNWYANARDVHETFWAETRDACLRDRLETETTSLANAMAIPIARTSGILTGLWAAATITSQQSSARSGHWDCVMINKAAISLCAVPLNRETGSQRTLLIEICTLFWWKICVKRYTICQRMQHAEFCQTCNIFCNHTFAYNRYP